MKKKYQIFVSSTYEDLKDERKYVINTILKMQHFPVGMEYFGARNEKQWAHIEDELRSSDYYILILKHKYGSIIEKGTDKGRSWTEKEFRFAESIGLPILSFIISDEAQIRITEVESEPQKLSKLNAFKKLASKDRLVEWWKNTEDLCTKIATALTNEIQNGQQRPGWVRSIDQYSDAYIDNLRSQIHALEDTIKKNEDDIKAYKSCLGIDEDDLQLDMTSTVKKAIDYYRYKLFHKAEISVLSSGSICFISNRLPSGDLLNTLQIKNDDTCKYLLVALYSKETISFIKDIAYLTGLLNKTNDYYCYIDGIPVSNIDNTLSELTVNQGSIISFMTRK